jgi:hypothetical protein
MIVHEQKNNFELNYNMQHHIVLLVMILINHNNFVTGLNISQMLLPNVMFELDMGYLLKDCMFSPALYTRQFV